MNFSLTTAYSRIVLQSWQSLIISRTFTESREPEVSWKCKTLLLLTFPNQRNLVQIFIQYFRNVNFNITFPSTLGPFSGLPPSRVSDYNFTHSLPTCKLYASFQIFPFFYSYPNSISWTAKNLRTAFLWLITQRVLIISYRRFGVVPKHL
jgi:hypothetical protein